MEAATAVARNTSAIGAGEFTIRSKQRSGNAAPSPRYAKDWVMVIRARADQAAFNRLLKEHHRLLSYIISGYSLPGGSQDDLYQEAAYGFYKAVQDYDGVRSSFRVFADLCVWRQVITAVKTATRGKHRALNQALSYDQGFALLEILSNPGGNPCDTVVNRDTCRILATAIQDKLSELERAALVAYANGYSYEEMAAFLGVAEKAVDNALQRAQRKLRKLPVFDEKEKSLAAPFKLPLRVVS